MDIKSLIFIVDGTHLVLVSGKPVLWKKNTTLNKSFTQSKDSKNWPQVLILQNFDERKSGKSIVVVNVVVVNNVVVNVVVVNVVVVIVVNVVVVNVVVSVVVVESLANQSKNFFPPKKNLVEKKKKNSGTEAVADSV